MTDSGTGVRLAGMVVAAYNVVGSQQLAVATTDSNGNYALTLPSGSYRLLAYDNSVVYATTYAGDADSFDTSTVLNVTGDVSGVNFGLRRAGSISGTVSSASTGVPLGGITVAAYNTSTGTRRGFTQTDTSGSYMLVLPPGTYRVAAYSNNGAYSARFFDDQGAFATAADIPVTAAQTRLLTNFHLSLAAHISGSVVDADTNLPLPSALVIVYGTDGSQIATATPDVAGNFTLNVPAGDYKFVSVDTARVYAAGFVADANSFANEAVVSVGPGQSMTGVRIPMHRAGAVSGTVSDASGAALAGITVAAYNDDGTQRVMTQTDTNGAYSLLLPQSEFRIAAFDAALVYATVFYPNRILFADGTPIPIVAGVSANAVNLSLVRGGKISGTITDQQTGGAISGITVAAYDDQGNVISTGVSSSAGKYALVVPAGVYRFVAFDSQLRYVAAYSGGAANFENASTMSLAAASTSQLDFALAQGVRLSGTVIDATNAFLAISDVQVGALDLSGNRVAAATTIDGAFNMVLAPGAYKLLVTDPLNRYYAVFYNGARTLAAATPVVVTANGAGSPITIFLTHATRRRAVH